VLGADGANEIRLAAVYELTTAAIAAASASGPAQTRFLSLPLPACVRDNGLVIHCDAELDDRKKYEKEEWAEQVRTPLPLSLYRF
jgi:hypothetical protein